MNRTGETDLAPEPEAMQEPSQIFEPIRKFPRWPIAFAVIVALMGLLVALSWGRTIGYYALAPGDVLDVDDYVVLEGDSVGEDGDLYFLTVELAEVNAIEAIAGWLNPEVDLRRSETVRPPDESPDVYQARQANLMEQSKQDAIWVALTRLGYEAESRGALMVGLTDETGADGILEPGDVIIELEGSPVASTSDLVDLMLPYAPGSQISLAVNRPDNGDLEKVDVRVTLVAHPDDPARPAIGILVRDDLHFPIEIEIDSQNIVGPSAGAMFTLEIYDLLTEDDIAKGHRIAGTGTISRDGTVGAIGGVRQKVFAAIGFGAEYILVPAGNFDTALDAAGDDIEVVRIESIDDALEFLAALS